MIKNIKTIFVTNEMNNQSFLTQNIFLDFYPDEMLVKKIDFNSLNVNANVFFRVYSDIVNNDIGYSRDVIPTTFTFSSNELQTRFKIKNPINGLYTFSIKNTNGNLYPLEGEIIICLEFVEYEK